MRLEDVYEKALKNITYTHTQDEAISRVISSHVSCDLYTASLLIYSCYGNFNFPILCSARLINSTLRM